MKTDTVDKIMIAVMVAAAIFLGNRIWTGINGMIVEREREQQREENKRE